MLSRAYGLPDDPLPYKVQVILPHCYGNTPHGIPDATIRTVTLAIDLAKRFDSWIVFADIDYLGPELQARENRQKMDLIEAARFPKNRVLVSAPCQNSVTEALNIRARLANAGVAFQTIAVIHDRPHGRSARKIYNNYVFMDKCVVRRNVDAEWNGSDHFVWLQQSNFRWLAANIARDILLMVKGAEGIGKMSYVSKG